MSQLISLNDITVAFNHQKIVSNVSFVVNTEQIVALLGPNGAGKSTLIKVVIGLIKPTAGTISRAADLTIGYVPQSITFNAALPITVKRFMQLNRQLCDAEIKQILAMVEADNLINDFMQQLSGGELQRILLAQALAKHPQLLVLDEPAQGVDVKGQILLYDLIAKARDEFKCGVLMVSHDLDLAMGSADNVICLNHAIYCEGSPKTVAKNPAFMALFNNLHKHLHQTNHKEQE
ncbi:ATP-binding cassette domain-containing protein [Orbaceae bacterium ESL0721]|nr:ATP-binding cassette domain-containing protein [Orbaceae bacterium ESL0721]